MDPKTPSELQLRFLGLQDYEPIWHAMQAYTQSRDATSPDELWILEHKPVFTQGQAGKAEHLLNCGDIPVVQVDRGGQVTYHGPGQLVIYLLLDIKRRKLGARNLVSGIEQGIVDVLGNFGIQAQPKAEAPGVYVDDKKIASLGLRIRRGCSFHGLSLNLAMNLEPFLRINPCGYAGLEIIQLADFLPQDQLPSVMELGRRLATQIAQQFNYAQMIENDALPDTIGKDTH